MSDDSQQPSTARTLARKAAYPLSAIAGWVYAHGHLRDSAYDMLKMCDTKYAPKGTTGKLAHLRTEHHKRLDAISRKEGDIKAALKQEHSLYKKEITEYMESKGFRNTIDYFKGAHSTNQNEALVGAFTAAGITLGVMFAITGRGQEQENKPAKEAQHSI